MFYPIIPVPDNAPELPEQQGTKTKYWIHHEGEHLLFKIGRKNTGENWAEKVACELCELLGLPHAHYDLAIWKQYKGVITKNIVPRNGRLVMGNELLSEIHESYPRGDRYKVQDHTLGRIVSLLSNSVIQVPVNWAIPDSAINDAVDVFLGYLLLDAWIANQDRHHENWGIISCNEQIYLAHTYDHAASMGQNEPDAKREELLNTRNKERHISRYVTKARSTIYLTKSENKSLPTLDAFQHLAQKRPAAAKFWLQKLDSMSNEQCQAIFTRIPPTEISDIAQKFAITLLELNKQRLLELTP